MLAKREWKLEADKVLKNAKIYTVAVTIEEIKKGNTDFPVIERGAVAIKDGKIIAVDEVSVIDQYIGETTEVIDLKGKTLIPGIIDSHTHAVWTGLGLLNVDLASCTSLSDMQKAIGDKVKTVKKGEWIQGLKWNHLSWDKKELPTRYDLDKIAPDHPVYCVRLCYHIAVANSKALELAGITKDTPDPEGGMFERDASGEPTGILHETGAMTAIASKIPEPNTEQIIRAIESAGAEYSKYGVTSLIDANLPYEQMRAYNEAKKQKRLKYRANLMYFLDGAKGSIDEHLKKMEDVVVTGGFGDDMLKINAVKILLDGIPAVGTAYMRENYKHMPETRGFTTITPEELNKVAVKVQEYNWQLALHTVGNAAADIGLDAFEKASKVSDVWNNRHYLIHHPWPFEDQLERMRKMNIGVSVQPTIYHFMGESEILPEKMAHQNTPCKQYFDAGVVVGGSSDSPIGNYNPFLSMFIAVTREDSKGEVWGENQKITPKQALIMYTKNSAFFSHDEEKMGSIEVGNLADMVVVDRDFLEGPANEIKDTKVMMTLLGGEVVYQIEQ